MSLSNILVTISAAGHGFANDSTAYLHHLKGVVESRQFSACPLSYDNEWLSLLDGFYVPIAWAIGVSILIFVFFWWVFKLFSSRWRDMILRWLFGISLLLGFIVYDIGTCTGEKFSLITNAPMAFLHALGMFVLDSDVSAIHEPFHNSWVYMALFSIAHTLAAVASTLFIIKHFGFHIAAALKMWWIRWFGRKKDETYVFWGLNEPTFRLIKSIKEHYGKEKNYRIIVVRSNKHGDDSAEGRSKFSRVFSFLALRNAELEKLQALKCLSASTNADSTEINLDELAQKRPRRLRRLFNRIYSALGKVLRCKHKGTSDWQFNIIGRELSLRCIRRILTRKTRQKIHMLFLSDNDNENLHDVALLLGDNTIKDFAKKTYKVNAEETKANSAEPQKIEPEIKEKNRQVIFYCHARYNSVHRVIEDLNSSENITVNVIDSSHINVEMLKSDEQILPVQFVKVEKDATVSSTFNALVVGFSEVGLDSARFLYEFGAFVKHTKVNTSAQVARSGFHLDVIDRNMPDLAGPFVANAPAIKPSMPFMENGTNDSALITLHEMDCCGAEFYSKLKDKIKELNYVVVATEDDELNISTGVRIFKMAARYRDSLEDFCILVRAHNDDDGHIRKIALHYNRLWAAQKAAAVQKIPKRELNQTIFRREQPADLPIYIFGLDKDVYTYKNIIDDALENDAINFKEKYEASTNHGYKPAKEKEKKAWVREYKVLMQLCTISDKEDTHKKYDLRPYYPTYGGLMKLRRTQGQDFANSLHRKTKIQLAEKALLLLRKNNDISVFKSLTRKDTETTYKYTATDKDENEINDLTRILDVLAQTEHLRWNASHEILGYTHADKYGLKSDDNSGDEPDGKCGDKQVTVTDDICSDKDCNIECKYCLGYKNEARLIHNCIRPWQNLDTYYQSFDYNIVDVTLGIINPQNPIPQKDKTPPSKG